MAQTVRPGRKLLTLALAVWGFVSLPACNEAEEHATFVARVYDAYLLKAELDAALENLPSLMDSTEARRQIIDQWIAGQLLYREALRRDIRNQESVRERLQQGERAVLIDALVTFLYEELEEEPAPSQIRTYFEVNRERMRLREPFVRIRYLRGADRDSILLARELLRRASSSEADSIFAQLIERFSDDEDLSRSLAANYVPESRVFIDQNVLRATFNQLRPGMIASVFEEDDNWHLLQVADLVPAGSLPELAWVQDQVRRQLTMDSRKQMYERQVQRLRMEALSQEALVVQ